MGPRFFNRGNLVRRIPGSGCSPSFNGGAVFQPRKSFWPCTQRFLVACFNGAAVFQPRKWELKNDAVRAWAKLQWGRGFSTAEIQRTAWVAFAGIVASMGPRFFNRG